VVGAVVMATDRRRGRGTVLVIERIPPTVT